jgi:hypothetical protein
LSASQQDFSATANNRQQPPTTANNHQQPPTTANNRQRRPTTANNGQQRPTTANNCQQPPTTANNRQQPPTTTSPPTTTTTLILVGATVVWTTILRIAEPIIELIWGYRENYNRRERGNLTLQEVVLAAMTSASIIDESKLTALLEQQASAA